MADSEGACVSSEPEAGDQTGGWSALRESPPVRRVERFMFVYGVVAAAAVLVVRGMASAAVLTLTVTAGIFLFRALQLQVSLLEPRHDGRLGPLDGLLLLLRLSFLGVLLLGALYLGSRYQRALILGLGALPMALMTEAVLQALGIVRGSTNGG